MKYDVDVLAGRFDKRRVLQIAARDLDTQFVKCRIPASTEHAHLGSVRQQLLHNVLPEKTTAASHQSFHADSRTFNSRSIASVVSSGRPTTLL